MKRPAFQFYPGDWLRSADLRSCSVGARGLWIEMICLMHDGSPYGYLKVNNKVILPANLARMVGATTQEIEGWLAELSDAGVYSLDGDCIYSRRMVKDEEIRLKRAAGGHLGGNPALTNHGNKVPDKVNLPANLEPTPAFAFASALKTKPMGEKSPELFDKFWKAYPKKKAKGAAEKAWAKIPNKPDTLTLILNALAWQTASPEWKKDGGQFIKHPATYLNDKGWLDEPETQQQQGPTLSLAEAKAKHKAMADEWKARQAAEDRATMVYPKAIQA